MAPKFIFALWPQISYTIKCTKCCTRSNPMADYLSIR